MHGIPRPLVRTNQACIMLFSIVALLSKQPGLLLIPLVIGVIALLTGKNIFFVLAKPFVKKPYDEYVLEDPQQQRFNQWIAVGFLLVAGVSYMLGWYVVSTILLGLLIITTGVAICGYCIGCTIRYRLHMWRYRQQSSKS